MNVRSAEMARRIRAALASGKLKADGGYDVPALCLALGTTRAGLRSAVRTEYGSIGEFCRQLGFLGMKAKPAGL